MSEYASIVLFTKALVAPVGLGIAVLAYRAYRETGDLSLRWFAVGFGVLTVGSILGGGLDRILGVGIGVGLLAHSLLTAVGFVILGRSVYMRDSGYGGSSTVTSSNE